MYAFYSCQPAGHLPRQRAEGRHLPAPYVDDVAVALEAVLAADGARIRGAADQRTDAGERRGDVLMCDRRAEVVVETGDEVIDLLLRGMDAVDRPELHHLGR